ncbi:MAG TPA: quinone oxidoreductase [Thermoanaerobaculia bacterium]|nr:quinone oxidoreductase [Thermoanaerobaculia bacterium]
MSRDRRSHAVRIHRTGGPEVLQWDEVQVDEPGPGQVRVRHLAIGLNYIDTYHRSGLYPLPPMPVTLGLEAAGEVVELGDGVHEVTVGDRVAYVGALGAYCQERVVDAARLVPIPEGISTEVAAASLLKGMTAEYLLRRTHPVRPGETILVQAAAGGVGLIACQWARALGARVLGTVSTDAKAELARQHGCDSPIVYTREDFVTRVKELTGGVGVPVVYDSVGQETFEGSLRCLTRRGLLVSFGQSSGPVPAFDLQKLSRGGSLFLTRPTLFDYTATRDDLLECARAFFEVVLAGTVRIEVRQRYPLAEARRAHEDLHGRRTVGSSVLLP